MEVRILNVMLGVWLLVAALGWNGPSAYRINTGAVGLVSCAVALLALRFPRARWVNLGLSLWLFASLWILPRQGEFELWDGMLAAASMFFTAGVPSIVGSSLGGRQADAPLGG